jgi:hypothetical protein
MDRRFAVSSLDVSNVVGTSSSSNKLNFSNPLNLQSNLKKKSSTYLDEIDENGQNDSSSPEESSSDNKMNLPSIQINDSNDNFHDVEEDYYDSSETMFKPKQTLSIQPRTPRSITKNGRQDDPFLRDLTACLQAKQQQKKLLTNNNQTKDSYTNKNYENYDAFEYRDRSISPSDYNNNNNGYQSKSNYLEKPTYTPINRSLSPNNNQNNSYNVVIKTPVNNRKLNLSITCETKNQPQQQQQQYTENIYENPRFFDTSLDDRFKTNYSFSRNNNNNNLNAPNNQQNLSNSSSNDSNNINKLQLSPSVTSSLSTVSFMNASNLLRQDKKSDLSLSQTSSTISSGTFNSSNESKFKNPTILSKQLFTTQPLVSTENNLNSFITSSTSNSNFNDLNINNNDINMRQIEESSVKPKLSQLRSFNFNKPTIIQTPALSSNSYTTTTNSTQPIATISTSATNTILPNNKVYATTSTNTEEIIAEPRFKDSETQTQCNLDEDYFNIEEKRIIEKQTSKFVETSTSTEDDFESKIIEPTKYKMVKTTNIDSNKQLAIVDHKQSPNKQKIFTQKMIENYIRYMLSRNEFKKNDLEKLKSKFYKLVIDLPQFNQIDRYNLSLYNYNGLLKSLIKYDSNHRMILPIGFKSRIRQVS